MIAIFGSGFGIYGYLPALASVSSCDILLLEKYRNIFYSRKELIEFENRIQWVNSVAEMICLSDLVVLALRPEAQKNFILANIDLLVTKYLILEKPLAESSDEAEIILAYLLKYKIQFRISYILLYTDWASKLKELSDKDLLSDTLLIEWFFIAHHYKNGTESWKNNPSTGGGIINFYGIHFIALSYFLGYQNLISSKVGFSSENNASDLEFSCQNLQGKSIIIRLNSFSNSSRFRIQLSNQNDSQINNTFLIDQGDLFESKGAQYDSRIKYLQNIYFSFENKNLDAFYMNIYSGTNSLWSQIILFSNQIS